ncbi:MAG: hypothetical protein K4H23_05420 [Mollicutes bacterium PWAP]|nr:hypothetical protein [Mollicutes bacterium PWAP]
MSKKISKKNKIIFGSSLGAISLVTIAIVTPVIILNSNKKEIKNHYKIYNSDLGFQLKILDVNGKYALDDFHSEKLLKYIKEEFPLGPEIFGLKDIVINDENFISNNENGSYYPGTNEIFINVRDLVKINSMDQDSILYYILSVFYHEYGHFKNSVYLNSVSKKINGITNQNSTQNIYSYNMQDYENWKTNFVNEFKKTFYYDNDTGHFSDLKISNIFQNDILKDDLKLQSSFLKGFHSLAYNFNQKDLFDIGNYKKQIQIINNKLNFIPLINNQPKVLTLFKEKIEDLQYYYSMQEISTRKMHQLQMPLYLGSGIFEEVTNKKNSMMNNHYYITDLNNKDEIIGVDAFIEDVMHYQTSLFSENDIGFQNPNPFSFIKENDFIFNNKKNFLLPNGSIISNNEKRNIKLYELMENNMGITNRDNITFLNKKNSAIIKEHSKRFSANPDDSNFIKFGGYLENPNYKYIKMEKNGNISFLPILLNKLNFKYKNKLYENDFSNMSDLNGNGIHTTKNLYFYSLKEYIKGDDLINSKLSFVDANYQNYLPLHNIKTNFSSYISNYPKEINKRDYIVNENPNGSGLVFSNDKNLYD